MFWAAFCCSLLAAAATATAVAEYCTTLAAATWATLEGARCCFYLCCCCCYCCVWCSASLIEFRIWPAICSVAVQWMVHCLGPDGAWVLHSFAANPLAEHISQLLPPCPLIYSIRIELMCLRWQLDATCRNNLNSPPEPGIETTEEYILFATLRGGHRRVEIWLAFYGLPTSTSNICPQTYVHNSWRAHELLLQNRSASSSCTRYSFKCINNYYDTCVSH